MKTFFWIIWSIFLFTLIIFSILALFFWWEMLNLKWQWFFAPKYEEVRRNTFEETKSYNQWKIQDLSNYYRQYNLTTDNKEKQTIEAVVKMQFADYDINNINSNELKVFLNNILY